VTEQPRRRVELEPTDLVVPLDRVWSATVDLDVGVDENGHPTGVMPVTEAVCQPMGLLHGGMYAAIAEELASIATGLAVIAQGKWCVGQSNITHFLHAARLGDTLHSNGHPIHTGRSSWVWDVESRNDDGRLCARSTVTMAVREGSMPGAG